MLMKIVLWILLIVLAFLVIDAKTPVFAWLSKLIARPLFKLIDAFPPIEYGPDRLVPIVDSDGNYYYETDRPLRIMQMTDVHFGCGLLTRKADKKAMNAIYAMISAEKPDLVIFTGDQIYPVIFQSGTFNNLLETRFFIAFLEHLGVFYTVTMGNHESEIYSPGTRKKIAELYDSPDNHYCIFKTGEDIAANISKQRTGFDRLPSSVQKTAIATEIRDFGYGNQVIKVKNSKGLITQAIFTMDTHSYTHGDYFGILYLYDGLHQTQIDWYEETLGKLSGENRAALAALPEYENVVKLSGENRAALTALPESEAVSGLPVDTSGTTGGNTASFMPPSCVFMHIPLREYKDAFNELRENNENPTADARLVFGSMTETGKREIYCSVYPDKMFETVQRLGSTKAFFCGHDHKNFFSIEYKGIRLTYGRAIDYFVYHGIGKQGRQRGCIMIDAEPNGKLTITPESYYQDKYKGIFPKETDIEDL